MVAGKRPIDDKYFHLSFDDGLRNVFTNAIPILRKHHVPAIFFVPSSLVGAGWTEAKAYCIDILKYREVSELVTWSDLKETCLAGFDIGSHTRTHARLTDLSKTPESLEDQVSGSKKEFENQLGIECKYISWPFGKRTDADSKSLAMIKERGYRACFGAFRAPIIARSTDTYKIPRHHFEVQWPLSHSLLFAGGFHER